MYSSFFNAHTGEKGVVLYGYINAFWVGGLICALTQILMEKTKLSPAGSWSFWCAAGLFWVQLGSMNLCLITAKAGASVPLLGFGNVLWEGVHDAVQEEGLLGIFKGGLTAGSAGTCAALVFGYLASLVFDSKMKK